MDITLPPSTLQEWRKQKHLDSTRIILSHNALLYGIHYSLCTQLLQTMRRVRQMVLLIKPYTAKSNRVYSTLT